VIADPFERWRGWAEAAAKRHCVARRIPAAMREDCIQAALIACWRCTMRHDAAQSAFETYAAPRIRGAVRDAVREASLFNRAGRIRADRLSLDIFEHEDRLLYRDGATAETDLERREAVTIVLRAISPARNRRIVAEYFLLGKSFREIAENLRISESRACALFHGAIARARRRLAAEREAGRL
jgi:RNA polymerase sigma factor (sigma-70 family)